jgi:hypothetical protein
MFVADYLPLLKNSNLPGSTGSQPGHRYTNSLHGRSGIWKDFKSRSDPKACLQALPHLLQLARHGKLLFNQEGQNVRVRKSYQRGWFNTVDLV